MTKGQQGSMARDDRSSKGGKVQDVASKTSGVKKPSKKGKK